jgi:hypothetical protein
LSSNTMARLKWLFSSMTCLRITRTTFIL